MSKTAVTFTIEATMFRNASQDANKRAREDLNRRIAFRRYAEGPLTITNAIHRSYAIKPEYMHADGPDEEAMSVAKYEFSDGSVKYYGRIYGNGYDEIEVASFDSDGAKVNTLSREHENMLQSADRGTEYEDCAPASPAEFAEGARVLGWDPNTVDFSK